MTGTALSPAADRTLALLRPQHRRAAEISTPGYLDVLGGSPPPVRTVSQRMMRTRVYSAGYQALRPLGFRIASGLKSGGRDVDRARVAAWLRLRSDSVVLDVGCGPGNFTGWFGSRVEEGLAIGVDASAAMLRRAVRDNSGPTVAYLRGDAEDLPIADGAVDAVCCLAALYLINDPFQAIAEMHRVLKPGGRMVMLTTVLPRGVGSRLGGTVLQRATGLRWFDRREVTAFVGGLGFVDVIQRIDGVTQTIVATRQ